MGSHAHDAFPKWERKQWGDVTSRGVSGRLMRQFSDSGAAPETVRKPPPSANYHLVRFIWQLGVTDCPASVCATGGERINSLPASGGDTHILSLSAKNRGERNKIMTPAWLFQKAASTDRRSRRYVSTEGFHCWLTTLRNRRELRLWPSCVVIPWTIWK